MPIEVVATEFQPDTDAMLRALMLVLDLDPSTLDPVDAPVFCAETEC